MTLHEISHVISDFTGARGDSWYTNCMKLITFIQHNPTTTMKTVHIDTDLFFCYETGIRVVYKYIYIYMCVCVCVCPYSSQE